MRTALLTALAFWIGGLAAPAATWAKDGQRRHPPTMTSQRDLTGAVVKLRSCLDPSRGSLIYMHYMEPQRIEAIRQQFRHEWLLIAVDEMDEATTTPVRGRLIAHSPDPMEIHHIAMQHDEFLATIYSDDWPEDLAACFYECLPA